MLKQNHKSLPGRDRDLDIESSLRAIYADHGGKRSDLSKLERRRSRSWLHVLILFGVSFALAGGALWSALVLWQPFREFKGGGIKLRMEGTERVTIGREETFKIYWTNMDKAPADHVEIRLGAPPDFIFTSSTPAPSDASHRLWQIGRVEGKRTGQIEVRGIFTGALDTSTAIQAMGTFRPAKFARSFDALAIHSLEYADSVLDGALTLPAKTFVGDPVVLTYTLANRGAHPLVNLRAHVLLPQEFLLQGSTSASRSGDFFLPLPNLPPHAGTSLTFTGSFASDAAGDANFRMEAGSMGADQAFLPFEKTEVRTTVLPGDLSLRLIANGSQGDRTIEPRDPIRLALSYQNTSPETLKNVSIRLMFESVVDNRSATGTSLLDWGRLDDALQGASSTKPRLQTIVYDRKSVPVLLQLLPQNEGVIELSLPTLDAATGTKEAEIRISAEANVLMVGSEKSHRLVRAAPIVLRYRSDANLTSEARYFTEEGAPIGSGPLPPVSGRATTYRVIWHLHKTMHPLASVTVSALLPKSASLGARTAASAGLLAFASSTREVRWTIDYVGDRVNDAEASFDVQLIPQDLDVGRFAELLRETNFQATDSMVNEIISRDVPGLSTDLFTDESARGKGVVRKP